MKGDHPRPLKTLSTLPPHKLCHLVENLERRGKDPLWDGVDITHTDGAHSHEKVSEICQMKLFFRIWVYQPVFPVDHSFVLGVKFSPNEKKWMSVEFCLLNYT